MASKLPSTSAIGVALVAIVAPVLAFLTETNTVHFSDVQKLDVSAFAAAAVAFAVALVAHFRKGSPERWVAVFGFFTPLVLTLLNLGNGFVWWNLTGPEQGYLLAVVAIVLGLFGVPVTQARVWSKQTRDRELQAATALVHPADIAK